MARSCLLKPKPKGWLFHIYAKRNTSQVLPFKVAVEQHMPATPALGGRTQKEHRFRVSLGHKGSSRQPKLCEPRPQTTKVNKGFPLEAGCSQAPAEGLQVFIVFHHLSACIFNHSSHYF